MGLGSGLGLGSRRDGAVRAVGELRARQQRDVHVARGVERGVEVRLVLLPRVERADAPLPVERERDRRRRRAREEEARAP